MQRKKKKKKKNPSLFSPKFSKLGHTTHCFGFFPFPHSLPGVSQGLKSRDHRHILKVFHALNTESIGIKKLISLTG